MVSKAPARALVGGSVKPKGKERDGCEREWCLLFVP